MSDGRLVHVLHAAGSRHRAAALVAGRQRGAISARQLQLLGFGRGAIEHRRSLGELHRMFRGIYLLGQPAPPPGCWQVAALLAAGARSLLSHHSAAAWWGFGAADPDPDPEVQVSVLGRHVRSRDGLEVHCLSWLPAQDRRRHRGLPVTSPTRTLLDLAARADPNLERAVSEAQVQGLISPTALGREPDRHPGQRGVRRLRELAAGDQGGFTRSEAERLMRRLCRQARLPQPASNVRLAGWEVDFLWVGAGLVVEIDGFRAHGHRAAFERDRRKQLQLVAAGYRVIRISWRQLLDEPLAVAAALGRALGTAQ